MTAHFTEDELVTQLVNRGVPHDKAVHVAAKETLVRQAEPPSKAKRRANTRKGKGVHKVDVEAVAFKILCREHRLPAPTTEHPFATTATPPRNFRFDFAWIEEKVAIEKNGGIWRKGGGAHTGTGHMRDMEKMNLAQSLGWVVIQRTPQQLCTLETLALVRQALASQLPSEQSLDLPSPPSRLSSST